MPENQSDFVIPKCEGRAFTVKKGQTLRIIEIEGVQAADLIAFNLHNLKESSSAWLTRHLHSVFDKQKKKLVSGGFNIAEKLYSRLPAGNVMFTVLNAREGLIWLDPGRCNRLTYERLYGVKDYHKNCQDILAECIEPHGLTPFDVPEVFNLFMTSVFNRDGSHDILPPPISKGDYVDLLAEMDLLCAVSACPSDMGQTNEGNPKPLGVQIFD